jgi:hypothetical protein
MSSPFLSEEWITFCFDPSTILEIQWMPSAAKHLQDRGDMCHGSDLVRKYIKTLAVRAVRAPRRLTRLEMIAAQWHKAKAAVMPLAWT